jgi:hypothetical protein
MEEKKKMKKKKPKGLTFGDLSHDEIGHILSFTCCYFYNKINDRFPELLTFSLGADKVAAIQKFPEYLLFNLNTTVGGLSNLHTKPQTVNHLYVFFEGEDEKTEKEYDYALEISFFFDEKKVHMGVNTTTIDFMKRLVKPPPVSHHHYPTLNFHKLDFVGFRWITTPLKTLRLIDLQTFWCLDLLRDYPVENIVLRDCDPHRITVMLHPFGNSVRTLKIQGKVPSHVFEWPMSPYLREIHLSGEYFHDEPVYWNKCPEKLTILKINTATLKFKLEIPVTVGSLFILWDSPIFWRREEDLVLLHGVRNHFYLNHIAEPKNWIHSNHILPFFSSLKEPLPRYVTLENILNAEDIEQILYLKNPGWAKAATKFTFY